MKRLPAIGFVLAGLTPAVAQEPGGGSVAHFL